MIFGFVVVGLRVFVELLNYFGLLLLAIAVWVLVPNCMFASLFAKLGFWVIDWWVCRACFLFVFGWIR